MRDEMKEAVMTVYLAMVDDETQPERGLTTFLEDLTKLIEKTTTKKASGAIIKLNIIHIHKAIGAYMAWQEAIEEDETNR